MVMKDITLWNGKTVPRIGIGTWVMGGEQYWDGKPTGWADVDDGVSLQTLKTAFDLGVRIIDTADQYGAGHSETVIAAAIAASGLPREAFVICTKVGMVCDTESGNIVGVTDNKNEIAKAIDASLLRLGVDHIDLVKFHLNGHPIDAAKPVFEAFSEAYESGKIGGFGWSTDDIEGALAYAHLDGYVAVQHDLNLFSPAAEMLRALEGQAIWSFNRQPLAMGLLTGKYQVHSKPAGRNDIRGSGFEWLRYFNDDGTPSGEMLQQVECIRDLLTRDGRSLAQGALGWCLAQSDRAIPLPGCRSPAQAKDNFGVLDVGPLSADILADLEAVMATNSS